MSLPLMLDFAAVRSLYAGGAWTPLSLIQALRARIDAADPAIFITRSSADDLRAGIEALIARAPEPNSLPLWGLPCAVKDNIDVAGLPTTAACPDFANMPGKDATVVARLRALGAIILGKTNLDQFATGLNGTRSPYGAPRCVFDKAYISGGSSSGSAVAVASGLVSFALGTDTAGSGRVPAALNNIVGIKPTPGLLSTTGVVSACRSLDCVSIFTGNVRDGIEVRRLAEGFDPADPWSRHATPLPLPATGLRVGILAPADRAFFGDAESARLYEAAIGRLDEATVEIDFAPFRETAALLYSGPWVAERLAAFESFGLSASVMDPAVAEVIMGGAKFSAVEAFEGLYVLEALKRRADAEWAKADVLLLPTVPTSYRVEEMLADPISLNSRLGTYTNFFNLLGYCGIAVPAGFKADGLPSGVTLAGRAFQDDALAKLADRLHRAAACGMGVDRSAAPPPLPAGEQRPETLDLAVVGAHLSGMPLNGELLDCGATLKARTRTSGDYRLFVLPNTSPAKPGLIHAPGTNGSGIEVEVWSLPPDPFGRFIARIPAPLGIGKIRLADGSQVSGFLCEASGVEGAQDITELRSWRAYIASLATAAIAGPEAN
jgi:allophanate hydrolase